jgi:hypothetical protein
VSRNSVVGLAAAKQRLVDAHRVLAAQDGADLGALTEILGVAAELDGMLRALGEELRHARATASGLAARVSVLERDLGSAEDELGRLRRESVAAREREQAQGVFQRTL